MALPVTISGTTTAPQNSYHGPFKSSGGAFYTILRDSTVLSAVEAWKATDPTSSFSEQDGANRPDFGSVTILSLSVFQKGDLLHVAGQNISEEVWYARFDMSTDAWIEISTGDRDILVDGAPDGARDACSIAVEETGTDIVILYQGQTDKVMGTNYERIDYAKSTDSGQTWSAGNLVAKDGKDESHWTGPRIVRGSSDRVHFFFADWTNLDAYQRTLRSDDTLETFPAAIDSAISSSIYTVGHGVSYVSGAATKIRCPYHDSSSKASVAKFDSADSPGAGDPEDVDVSDNTVRLYNNSTVSCLAVNGTDLQLLYADFTDQDLYRDSNDDDAGWGTDTEEWDAVDIRHVSSNVYDRSGAKLAMIVDDGGTVKYNEVALAAAAASLLTRRPVPLNLLVR